MSKGSLGYRLQTVLDNVLQLHDVISKIANSFSKFLSCHRISVELPSRGDSGSEGRPRGECG
jgi:hypothetical protein